jgi:hypothetical protein
MVIGPYNPHWGQLLLSSVFYTNDKKYIQNDVARLYSQVEPISQTMYNIQLWDANTCTMP